MPKKKLKVAVIFGTRPEAIKMAPIIRELKKHRNGDTPVEAYVCLTGQHATMLEQAMEIFDVSPDDNLKVMKYNQDLLSLNATILTEIGETLKNISPDLVLVQGDTTTAFATALAAFYLKIKIGHVEAGLRSFNKFSPFPEEMNRVLASHLADYHFCPTENSKKNLLKENIGASDIIVTGNTVIDALHYIASKLEQDSHLRLKYQRQFHGIESIHGKKKLILVTGHRRENFGSGLKNICHALKQIVLEFKQVEIVYPVHLNPNVKSYVYEHLKGTDRIFLLEPLDYLAFVYLMSKSHLILTDSGGIQEEAPSLGKPVLVMRDVTERVEGTEAGTVRMVGTKWQTIVSEAALLLNDSSEYNRMSRAHNPYGDGKAAQRIVRFILGRTFS